MPERPPVPWSPSRRALLAAGAGVVLLPRGAGAADPSTAEGPLDPAWIVARRLPHDTARAALTRAYLSAHLPPGHPHSPTDVHMTPQAVVLHWTGSASAEGAWQTFAPATLGGRPELQGAGALHVSAHFVVSREGTCWRLLSDARIARHVIGLNHCAIGVENAADGPLGGPSPAGLTAAQVDRNVALVRLLVARHPTIQWLLGHHEYRRMEATPLFAERDPHYRTTKRDPGDAFMAAVRAGVADLGLRSPP